MYGRRAVSAAIAKRRWFETHWPAASTSRAWRRSSKPSFHRMRITLCGTGAGVNTALRANAGIVLQANERTIMLDCGGGSVREAVRAGIAIRSIEAVCLSHLHQDHCIDLSVLLGDRAFGRMTLPAVYGPQGVELFTRSAAFHVKTSAVNPKPDAPEFGEVADGEVRDVCGFTTRWAVTPHAPDLVAMATRYKVDGRSVVYSGDTRAAPGHGAAG